MAPGVPVAFFFAISGFLIASSLDRDDNLKRFAFRRALRIYPALWIAILVPLVLYCITGVLQINIKDIIISLPLELLTGISLHAFDTPTGGLGNGSLWTISVQIQFYILIAVLWKPMKMLSTKVWMSILFSGIVLSCLDDAIMQYSNLFTKIYGYTVMPYLYIFFLGTFLYLQRKKYIPWLKEHWKVLLLIFLLWHWSSELLGIDKMLPGKYINVITGVFATVVVIATGFGIGKIRFKHDISYSLFLWHMPVIDILRLIGGIENSILLFGISMLVSILAALVSCKFVEEPILRLKTKIHI